MGLAHGLVLVSLGCYDKYHSLSGLNNKEFFLTVPESGKSRFKVLAGSMWCLVRNFFLVCRQWPPCCCILTWWKEINSLIFLLPRALNPIYGGSTLMTYLPPKVSKCDHTGGYGFNVWMLGEHKYSVYITFRTHFLLVFSQRSWGFCCLKVIQQSQMPFCDFWRGGGRRNSKFLDFSFTIAFLNRE